MLHCVHYSAIPRQELEHCLSPMGSASVFFNTLVPCIHHALLPREGKPIRRNPHTATHHLLLVKAPQREVCLDKRVSPGVAPITRER